MVFKAGNGFKYRIDKKYINKNKDYIKKMLRDKSAFKFCQKTCKISAKRFNTGLLLGIFEFSILSKSFMGFGDSYLGQEEQ